MKFKNKKVTNEVVEFDISISVSLLNICLFLLLLGYLWYLYVLSLLFMIFSYSCLSFLLMCLVYTCLLVLLGTLVCSLFFFFDVCFVYMPFYVSLLHNLHMSL